MATLGMNVFLVSQAVFVRMELLQKYCALLAHSQLLDNPGAQFVAMTTNMPQEPGLPMNAPNACRASKRQAAP